MPLVAPNQGLPTLIGILFRDTAFPVLPWQMILWTNNIVPDQDTELEDLTEATFTGYGAVSLDRATWTAPVIVADKAVTTYDTVPTVWTCTGAPQDIYGYAIFDPDSDFLLIVERFAALVDLSAIPLIGVLPRVTLTTEA